MGFLRESAQNITRKGFHGDYGKSHSACWMAFPDFTICLEAATYWSETAGPQRLRHPPTRAIGDKEPLDKAQVFVILSVEGYSVI